MKKKETKTSDKKTFSNLHENASLGMTASDRSIKQGVTKGKFTFFNTSKFNRNSKLAKAYETVRNFDIIKEKKKFIDIKPTVTKLGFLSIKRKHPSFPSDESYLKNASNAFLYPHGKVLIIIDNAIWTRLKTRIHRYVLDIAKEGYWADIYTVENANAHHIKGLIKSASPRGALLVGNIPAAFYKHENDTFPCDLYYMDINGTWKETNTSGVFDGHSNNVNPEIWIGRLFTPTNNGNDITLLKEYFDRNHKFRNGNMEHRRNALSFVDDDWAGYPKKIKKAWSGFPSSFQNGVDAAVKWPHNNKVYFFKDDKYIRYNISNRKVDAGYPKKIAQAWSGFPSNFQNGVDAAITWPTNNKIYFFKGNKYLRYDTNNHSVDPGYPKLIKNAWRQFPNSFQNGISAGFAWPNGKIYFFKDDEYIRYDSSKNKMDPGYPKRIKSAWRNFPKEFQTKVDTAVIFPNDNAYIFSDNMFLCYDTNLNKVQQAGFDDCYLDAMFPSHEVDVVTHPDETRASNYKTELLKPRSWVQLCAHSNIHLHAFAADPPSGYVSNTYLSETEPPQAYFYNLFCCSSGRFTTNEYIAGWYLFDKAGGGNCQGLAVIASSKSGSMLSFEDFYLPLGQGKVIGDAFKNWWIKRGPSHDNVEISWFYGMVLLGDPTLTWYKGCVPIPTTPNDGETLNHYPRKMILEWEPVKINGVKYDVEIDAFHALATGKWAAETNQVWYIKHNISGNIFSHTFVGAQRGRWRVRSRIGNNVSPWCKWQYFRFTL